MRLLATALTLGALASAGPALAGTEGTGGAQTPLEPATGGAVAPEPADPPSAPAKTERKSSPSKAKSERPGEPPAAPEAAVAATVPAPEPSLGQPGEPARKAQSKPRNRRKDMDVEVPVPEDPEPAPEPAPPPPEDREEASAGLPRAGLEVIPLAAIGFAMMITGLVVQRLVSRRSD